MAHDVTLKDKLRQLYCFERMGLERAADLCQISYASAKRWKSEAKQNGDNWDKVRAAHTIAGGEIEDVARQLLTDLVLQFKATMDALNHEPLEAKERVALLTSLADSYHKAIAANKKLLPETSKLAIALLVLERLADYLKLKKPDLLQPFIEILAPFGETLKDL
ncbi:MAG: DUF1804 family protein [Cardiobacteriaceae bacterium]|nr:DUF1804 family protein [Cardiobacteriaceae bacterium]